MKSLLRTVDDHGDVYTALVFVCPACPGTGLHMLPVNPTDRNPRWDWDGNLEAPTLYPSIRTITGSQDDRGVCHSLLRGGVFEFLSDSTHEFAGQSVEMPDLPEWVTDD